VVKAGNAAVQAPNEAPLLKRIDHYLKENCHKDERG
jgi:hypothetical protein